jgi:hypothetical protein
LCCPTRGRVYRSIFKEIQREDVQGRRIDWANGPRSLNKKSMWTCSLEKTLYLTK